MKDNKLPGEIEVKANLRNSISAFCRWRINNNFCNESDNCTLCPIGEAYEMARDNEE